MFVAWLYPLHQSFSFLNVFRYISFRVLGAGITSLLISMFLGPCAIWILKKKLYGQQVRNDGPETHLKKKGTPTMGGMLILFSLTLSTLLWCDLSNSKVVIVLLSTLLFGVIGFLDDYRKIVKKNPKGLSGKEKLIAQSLIAIGTSLFIYFAPDFLPVVKFPFLKDLSLNLGWGIIFFSAFVLIGSSNAVNLTDGLDGLAVGPLMTVGSTFLILSYCSGNLKVAEYLQLPYVPGSGELSVFCSALCFSCLGFLWFNTYPAQVFMGDVGSLALGGALGSVAVITKNEILLALCGGVFVVEALSVMAQVASFKLTGKRVFRMAPLHHHFELKGWAEPKVIVRFWIVSVLLALLTLSTLKLR